ncbi:hypothetical protein LDENG_00115540 [Lucifuga dentata]|nr:hypothetical protein LDENG_00115540 [Lucifuga dentata]
MQLMELAILNGTYRDANIKSPALAFSLAASTQTPRILQGPAPIQTVLPNGTPHPGAALMPPGAESGLIYATPYEYPYTLAPASILEYPLDSSGVLGAVAAKVRRHELRVHPYQRVAAADRG